MKASLLPLSGKYYSTKILVENGPSRFEIEIRRGSGFAPSERELHLREIPLTPLEWELSLNLLEGKAFVEKYGENALFFDNHYETQETFEIAQKIVRALNGNKI